MVSFLLFPRGGVDVVEGTGSRQRLCFHFRPIDLLFLMPRSPGTTGWSMSQSPTLSVLVRGTKRVHVRGVGSCSCHQAQLRDSSVFGGRCRRDQLKQSQRCGCNGASWDGGIAGCSCDVGLHHFARPLEEAPSVMRSVPHFFKGPF